LLYSFFLPRKGGQPGIPNWEREKGQWKRSLDIGVEMIADSDKRRIKGRLGDLLHRVSSKAKHGRGLICPFCKSGAGKNGTSALSVKGDVFHCNKCDAGGDIFNFVARLEGMDAEADFPKVLEKTCEMLGEPFSRIRENANFQKQAHAANVSVSEEKTRKDYSNYINDCIVARRKSDRAKKYLYGRGLNDKSIERFRLGYDEKKDMIVFPYNAENSYYILRSIEEKQYLKPKTEEAGHEPLYNPEALENRFEPIFITEGTFDAISIEQLGYRAVAIVGVGGDKLLKLEKSLLRLQLIIALDHDNGGIEPAKKLSDQLSNLGIVHVNATEKLCEKGADINDALTKDRESLCDKLSEAVREVNSLSEDIKREYMKNSAASHLQAFVNGIAESVNTPYIPTGFAKLDDMLDGGLFEGLYIVGAISSLGKTTLVAQIADQIAQGGRDVLYFSLEMARTEIMAKSISRLTLLRTLNGGDIRNAKTSRGITTGARYIDYSSTERELIQASVNAYGEYAGHIYISEGIGDIGAEQIREQARRHILLTGNNPAVVIDYLQILAPYNERATDKQNTDKAALELKRISRDYKIPVIGISSFNRQSYRAAVTMEAFKESGAIEYSSDVLIGLQLKGAGEEGFDVNAEKSKNPRNVELVILKNRNGKTGEKIEYEYYPLFNYFQER
jgi:replicative DNA helicase